MHYHPLVYILPALVVAAWLGMVVGRNIFQGGWKRRWTHRTCGWFEVHGFRLPGDGEPCPRCGEVNANWHWRTGRPISFLPFGWEWKTDDRVTHLHAPVRHAQQKNDSPLIGRPGVTRNPDGSVKSIRADWA